MTQISSYALGRAGEELACEILKKNGFFIAARNYRSERGEIDIIAESREELLFVEVKLRSFELGYMPREAVTYNKQKRIRHAANNFVYRSKNSLPIRFDIIEIIMNERLDLKDADVNWIKNAF